MYGHFKSMDARLQPFEEKPGQYFNALYVEIILHGRRLQKRPCIQKIRATCYHKNVNIILSP
jgi:hypothetical protein